MNILIVCGEYFNQSNGLSLSTQRFVEQLNDWAMKCGCFPRIAAANQSILCR